MTTELKTEEKVKESSWYTGEIEAVDELYGSLSPEEDKRILRKLDMWCEPETELIIYYEARMLTVA